MCRLRSLRLRSGDFCFFVSELGWARLDYESENIDCGRTASNERAVVARLDGLPASTMLVRAIV